jgi:hypothetical protein
VHLDEGAALVVLELGSWDKPLGHGLAVLEAAPTARHSLGVLFAVLFNRDGDVPTEAPRAIRMPLLVGSYSGERIAR